jgi:hypothetical protein
MFSVPKQLEHTMSRPTAKTQDLAMTVLGTGLALGILLQVLRHSGLAG